MNLVTRFFAARRDKLLMKLGCWLVCFSLVLGLMLPQQRAEAVGTLTIAAVASVAAAYLGACGMTFITQGMDKDSLVSTTQRLIQEFLDTELGGKSIQDWLGTVWNVAVLAGKIVMGRPLTEEMMDFAQWVAGKYAVQAGENVVYSDKTITADDGTVYVLAVPLGDPVHASNGYPYYAQYTLGTDLTPLASGYTKENRRQLQFCGKSIYICFNGAGQFCWSNSSSGENLTTSASSVNMLWFSSDWLRIAFVAPLSAQYPGYLFTNTSYSISLSNPVVSEGSLSIDRAPFMSYIPEGIEADQGIALDVGASAAMDLDQVLGGVLDDVIAGELTSTMTAADEKTEPVDPPAEELPDVGELGLPALGAALTSRFPFSIPWDFFRAVQLLAVPAKAPYFEVDFMEPLADDVGGWQGDTTVVLDFSEYAIIGQISRWTSTIGFCLMLAGATKRLIWTA